MEIGVEYQHSEKYRQESSGPYIPYSDRNFLTDNPPSTLSLHCACHHTFDDVFLTE